MGFVQGFAETKDGVEVEYLAGEIRSRYLWSVRLKGDAVKGKTLIIVIFVVGILTTLYGMIKDKQDVFIIGLVIVIVGYAIVRTNLKRYFGDRS